MNLLRILVNGDRLSDDWTKLAAPKPRRFANEREDLIHHLTRYYDACGVPITVVFGPLEPDTEEESLPSSLDVEVVYSPVGQKADLFMLKLARRLQGHGEILMVTDAPQTFFGSTPACQVASCQDFVRTVEETLKNLEHNITAFNEKERAQFTRTD